MGTIFDFALSGTDFSPISLPASMHYTDMMTGETHSYPAASNPFEEFFLFFLSPASWPTAIFGDSSPTCHS
jgi:hypothetical protein